MELGEALFNAYNDQGPNPWKTFDGRDVPRWPDLSDQVRAKWRAVARAAQGTGECTWCNDPSDPRVRMCAGCWNTLLSEAGAVIGHLE
jgi:hypothetical protein